MLRQILIVACVFLITLLGLTAAGVRLAGSIAVVLACIAVWISLRQRGESLAVLGVAWPPGIARPLWTGLGYALLGYLAAIVATVIATRMLGWSPVQVSRLAALDGNTLLWLGMLVIAWTTAAFGEELLFRGFLLGRVRALLGPSRAAAAAAVLLQAIAFGLSHAYQGPTGMLVTGFLGSVFGLLYLRSRSLWPLVVAHGVIDTISLTAIYLGGLRMAG